MQVQAYQVAAPGLRGRGVGRRSGAWEQARQTCQRRGALPVWLQSTAVLLEHEADAVTSSLSKEARKQNF